MTKSDASALIAEEEKALTEQCARIEHARWSKWQSYLHSKCVKNDDGSLTIPAELVTRWQKQIDTPYEELTEKEKDSDREQVQAYLPLIVEAIERIVSSPHLRPSKPSRAR